MANLGTEENVKGSCVEASINMAFCIFIFYTVFCVIFGVDPYKKEEVLKVKNTTDASIYYVETNKASYYENGDTIFIVKKGDKLFLKEIDEDPNMGQKVIVVK